MALFELPLWAGSTNSSPGRGDGSLNGIEARARTPGRANVHWAVSVPIKQ
jgi:hypothetical protein